MRRNRHERRNDISQIVEEVVQEALEEYRLTPDYQLIEETITSAVNSEVFINRYRASTNPFSNAAAFYAFAVWIHEFKENALVELEKYIANSNVTEAVTTFCAINLELSTFEEILERRARNSQYTSSYDLALLLSDLHHKPGTRYMLSASTNSMFIVDGEGEEERGEYMPINVLLRDIKARLVERARQADTDILME